MITVTEDAKQKLNEILSSTNLEDPQVGLRLVAGTWGRFDLMLDEEKEGDQVVKYHGWKVLLVDGELSAELGDVILDCEGSTGQCNALCLKQADNPLSPLHWEYRN